MLKALKEVQNTLMYLQALKQLPPRQLAAERRLQRKLANLFEGIEDTLISEILKLGRAPSGLQLPHIRTLLAEGLEGFKEIMLTEAMDSAQYGRNRIISDLQRQGVSIQFSEFSNQVKDIIQSKVFEASEMTMERIVGDVMGVLTDGYTDGLGIDELADNLLGEFEDLETWEARRIARTEINSYQNEGAHQTEQELGIEFHMWWSADDERVRDNEDSSHVDMHGQIVRVGEPFSNGLYYPGDKSGDISEWINCRCRIVPFIMPIDMMAPAGKDYFYEHELQSAPNDPNSMHEPKEWDELKDNLEYDYDGNAVRSVFTEVESSQSREAIDLINELSPEFRSQSFSMDSLASGQTHNSTIGLQRMAEALDTPQKIVNANTEAPITVARYGGQNIILDGNHRATLLYAHGIESLETKFVNLDELLRDSK